MAVIKNGFNAMLSCKEAADYVGISLSHFRRWLRGLGDAKRIPHYQIGKRKFCKPEDLDKWVERHRKK